MSLAGEERETLRELRRELAELSRVTAPAARLLESPAALLRSVAILPGAFNPPTLAHLELARAALAADMDAVLLSIGLTTIDKPGDEGLVLEDRLLLLLEITRADPRLGVAIHNRGLYEEQAAAFRALLPDAALAFVSGTDKLVQLFDPGYYENREASLGRLFRTARLLVADRADVPRPALEAVLDDPLHRRHAGLIREIALDPAWHGLSSTRVRERLLSGGDVAEDLPAPVAAFLRRTGAFTDAARYEARVAGIRRL